MVFAIVYEEIPVAEDGAKGGGFDAESAPVGLGVATMQDYADALGGQCVILSAPGAGTEVTAVLPLARLGAEHSETLEKVGA